MTPHATLSLEFPVGSRVELAPHLDAWMRGDRYGTVSKVGRRTLTVSVKLDKSGRTRRFQPHNLQPA